MPRTNLVTQPPAPADDAAIALVNALPGSVSGVGAKYSPELAAEIVMRVAEGQTLTKVCAEFGIATYTFRRWVVAFEDLRSAWNAAKALRAGSLFDRALDIAGDLEEESMTVSANRINALRVAIETLKWAAAKLAPQEYGERVDKGPVVAIQINTGLDLGVGVKQANPDEGGLFQYTLTASLPQPGASAEITPSASAPKSRAPVEAGRPKRPKRVRKK